MLQVAAGNLVGLMVVVRNDTGERPSTPWMGQLCAAGLFTFDAHPRGPLSVLRVNKYICIVVAATVLLTFQS